MKDILDQFHQEISRISTQCGRDPGEVQLLPVSKTKPMEMLLEAYQAGERVFGENRIMEACEKKDLLPADAEIDFIGHLQSNKAAQTPGRFRLIHSLDSLKLAKKLSRLNQEAGLVQSLLIELNCSDEENKEGYRDEEVLFHDLEKMLILPGINIEGFMTMAPWVSEEAPVRKAFARCREIRDLAEEKTGRSFPRLSMGMTNDYPLAIEEGSTIVRIGTALFGGRG